MSNSSTTSSNGKPDRSRPEQFPLRQVPDSPNEFDEAPPKEHFSIRVRGIHQNSGDAAIVEHESVDGAVVQAIAMDVSKMAEAIMSWRGMRRLAAIDIDRPHAAERIREERVPDLFPETLPRPCAAWVTHDGGLRVLFAEVIEEKQTVSADALAGTWALLAPLGQAAAWPMEVKSDSRHPESPRGNDRCGVVCPFSPSATIIVPSRRGIAIASEEARDNWLEARGFEYGRHDSTACPSCVGSSSGNPPVVINEGGLHCFRCGEHWGWDFLVGNAVHDDQPSLAEAARNFIHFPHQSVVLHDLRPSVPTGLLRPAWHAMLRAVHGTRLETLTGDARTLLQRRIEDAASEKVDLVRATSGAWLDATTLRPRRVSAERTMKFLPWCRSLPMVDKAMDSGPLEGFVSVEPLPAEGVVGPYVESLPGSIFVRAAPRAGEQDPVEIGDGPPPADLVGEAWTQLEQRLPGLHRGYLSTLICANLVAQRAAGLPPVVIATGGTGVAKSASVVLVGGALGRRAALVSLAADGDVMRRKIGASLEAGSGFIYCDELGRVPDVYSRLEAILGLNSVVAFEMKYANLREARVDAAIVLLGSSLPTSIVKSPELSRRAVGFRLLDAAPNWQEAMAEVGDIANIRRKVELRNVIDLAVRDVWWKVYDLGPGGNWRKLCMDTFGAVELAALDLDDAGGEGRDGAIRKLYELYRDSSTKVSDTSKYKGWLEADPGTAAGAVLAELVDFEGTRQKTHAEGEDLHRLDLESVLGFSQPKLTFRVHRHSGRWYAKFMQLGVRRGSETKREELPRSLGLPPWEKPSDSRDTPDPPAPPVAPPAAVAVEGSNSEPRAMEGVRARRPGGSGGTKDSLGLEIGELAASDMSASGLVPRRKVRV